MNAKLESSYLRGNTHKRIFHFKFFSQEEMNKTFIRFSEFSESPRYKNTFFVHQRILDYIPDYYELVLGHNIPGKRFLEFLKVFNKKLTFEERAVVREVKKVKNLQDFYIIANFETKNKEYNSLAHETAHALYYLNPDYKKEIGKVLEKYMWDDYDITLFFSDMYDILDFKDYDKGVWTDEIHAFLLDLSLGSIGFFYGRNIKGFLRQLKAGKIHLHFKYKKAAKEILDIVIRYAQDITSIEYPKFKKINRNVFFLHYTLQSYINHFSEDYKVEVALEDILLEYFKIPKISLEKLRFYIRKYNHNKASSFFSTKELDRTRESLFNEKSNIMKEYKESYNAKN
jgi:uncharacterized protein Usg